MTDNARHYPDVDEFVWVVETGELGSPWGRWLSPPGGAFGGLAPCPGLPDAVPVARQALDDWFARAARAHIDVEDLWIRASVWRLGRIIDGGLIRSTPGQARGPAEYGRLLYHSDVDPDVVEVRTPYQVVRAVDAAWLSPSTHSAGSVADAAAVIS